MAAIPRIIALGRLAAFVSIALSMAACGSRFGFGGHWEGSRAMKGTAGTPPYIMVTVNAIKLDILPDGHFKLQDMGVPKGGYASIQGDKAILNVTSIMGKEVESQSQATQESNGPIELTAQPDGTLLYSDPKALDPAKVRLKRIATPPLGRP